MHWDQLFFVWIGISYIKPAPFLTLLFVCLLRIHQWSKMPHCAPLKPYNMRSLVSEWPDELHKLDKQQPAVSVNDMTVSVSELTGKSCYVFENDCFAAISAFLHTSKMTLWVLFYFSVVVIFHHPYVNNPNRSPRGVLVVERFNTHAVLPRHPARNLSSPPYHTRRFLSVSHHQNKNKL